MIGGTAAADRNLISGNTYAGVQLDAQSASSDQNLIEGNWIGPNAAGTAAVSYQGDGVLIRSDLGDPSFAVNEIGSPNAPNVISGNGVGVALDDGDRTTVEANLIGLAPDGVTAMGNFGDGVALGAGTGASGCGCFSTNVEVGGGTTGFGNTIADNGKGIDEIAGSGDQFLANSIWSNGTGTDAIGIDLGGDGVTPNDPTDADTGPNDLQNFPVITSAVTTGGGTSIHATLTSKAQSEFELDFYSSPTCDANGYGEGKSYLGYAFVHTNANGRGGVTFASPTTLPAGKEVTATATTDSGAHETSEFSRCRAVQDLADLSVKNTDSPDPVQSGLTLTYSIEVLNNGPDTAHGVRMSDALPSGVTFESVGSNVGSCRGSANVVCKVASLAAGDMMLVTLKVKAGPPGEVNDTATARSSDVDTMTSNNSMTATTTISP